MSKTGISNMLLGRTVTPAYFDMKWEGSDMVPDTTKPTGGWPTGFKPSLDGKYSAKIVTVWTQAGLVRVALVDPHGNLAEAYLTHLKLVQ